MNKYPLEFDQFWAMYPKGCRRDGCGSLQGGKKDAFKVWRGLDAQEKKDALMAVDILKTHQYLPHASRWLRAGFYEAVLENQTIKPKRKKCGICGKPSTLSAIAYFDDGAARVFRCDVCKFPENV